MSVNRARLSRPVLKRTKPIRTVGGQAPGGAVADGVRLGYSVIDEYLKRGQQAAKNVAAGGSPLKGASNELQQLTERMFKYASDLASAWMDLLQAMTTNGLAQRQASEEAAQAEAAQAAEAPERANGHGANGKANGKTNGKQNNKAGTEAAVPAPASQGAAAAPARPAAAGEPRPVAVEIDASQPVEVMLDLRPAAGELALEVTELRAKDPTAAPLAGVTVATAADPPRTIARVSVPHGQPPGLYTGLVLDAATNLPCGTLAVRVHAATRPRPPLQ
jgi:hypothetical protein